MIFARYLIHCANSGQIKFESEHAGALSIAIGDVKELVSQQPVVLATLGGSPAHQQNRVVYLGPMQIAGVLSTPSGSGKPPGTASRKAAWRSTSVKF